jgi:hypothetical protein
MLQALLEQCSCIGCFVFHRALAAFFAFREATEKSALIADLASNSGWFTTLLPVESFIQRLLILSHIDFHFLTLTPTILAKIVWSFGSVPSSAQAASRS